MPFERLVDSDTGHSNTMLTSSPMTATAALPKFREQYLSRIANGSYSFSRVPGERPLPVFTTGSYGHTADLEFAGQPPFIMHI
jgi:hypothetical protein